MNIFYVTFENDFSEQEGLVFEAEDCVSALMKAQDFIQELNRRLAEKHFNPGDVVQGKVTSVQQIDAMWLTEESMAKYVEESHVYVGEEEED